MKLDRLWQSLLLTSAIAFLLGTPAKGEEVGENIPEVNKNIPQPSEVELPATNAQMLVQQPTLTNPSSVPPNLGNPSSVPPNLGGKQGGVVSITGVVANPTDKGVEIILQTTQGKVLQPVTLALGRSYIANIPNAVLALPQGEFRQDNPASGITRVRVTQATANSIRVTVTGESALPQVQLYDSPNEGLIFSFTPGASTAQPTVEDEQREIVVTGEQDEGYNPSSASTATRTDTPLRDIPQSIQVVPQEVLRDRNLTSLTQAVETVSGVVDAGDDFGAPAGSRIIRGFTSEGNFRNGVRDVPNLYTLSSPIGVVEQVEVLKGPASVLFGAIEPGGIINVITRQPLSEPYYNLAFETGNFGFYQPSVDLSGPLTTDDTVLYRFIASYQRANGFQEFVETNQTAIAPSITFNFGERTSLNLYYEYSDFSSHPGESYSLVLSDGNLTPRDLYIGYPDFARRDNLTHRFGYTFTHEFNEDWRIRNNFAGYISDANTVDFYPTAIEDDRFVSLESNAPNFGANNYFAQVDLLGEFETGLISHQLLMGFDFNDFTERYKGFLDTELPPLDIRDPNYDISEPNHEPFLQYEIRTQSYGGYIQDRITLLDNLKLLIGGRYDWVSDRNQTFDFGTSGNTTEEPFQNNGAFSPRIGLVYQPNDIVSLYASYSRSFRPSSGFNPDGEAFEPTRGTQYEIGTRVDFLEGRLSANLAAYHLTRTNILTPDPDNPDFSVQTGEARSQGIELDVTGKILPGWNVILSYAYTDAEVTEDNTIPEGNLLAGVPENQASLWTTYEIQDGTLEGLGFGLGLFYVGERQGDLDNSFQLDSYLRTDAALYYRRDRFRAAINIRNLFDIDYARSSYGPLSTLRGAPFTIVGSVSWEF